MYDDFQVTDRWTKKPLHCVYQALVAAISTRHADAIDVKFLCGGRPVWIAMPHTAWVEYKQQTGKDLNDQITVQAAGHYLKTAIEEGLDTSREMHALDVSDVLRHVKAVLEEAGAPADYMPKFDEPAA